MIRSLLCLLPALALAGCYFEINAPRIERQELPEGLAVDLVVDPATVNAGEPFIVQLNVTNTTSDTIQIATSHGCLVTVNILRHGRRVPFKGSDWGCTAAVRVHTFPPGETHERSWVMRAELYAEKGWKVDGRPAPRGGYIVQAEFDTAPRGEGPAVETALVVK